MRRSIDRGTARAKRPDETSTVTIGADDDRGLVGLRGAGFAPLGFFAALIGFELFQLQSGAEAALAPTVFRIEREQPGIEFGNPVPQLGQARLVEKTPAAAAAPDVGCTWTTPRSMLQPQVESPAQFGLPRGTYRQCGHGKFDVVLDEAIESRPLRRGQHRAVDLKGGKTPCLAPTLPAPCTGPCAQR